MIKAKEKWFFDCISSNVRTAIEYILTSIGVCMCVCASGSLGLPVCKCEFCNIILQTQANAFFYIKFSAVIPFSKHKATKKKEE